MQRKKFFVVTFQPPLHAGDGPDHEDAEQDEGGGDEAVEQQAARKRDHPDHGKTGKLEESDHDDRRNERDPTQLLQGQRQLSLGERVSRNRANVTHHASTSRMRSNVTTSSSRAWIIPKSARGGSIPNCVM